MMNFIYVMMLALIVLGGLGFIAGFLGIIFKNKAAEEKKHKFFVLSICLLIIGALLLAIPSVYIICSNADKETGLPYEETIEGAVALNDYDMVKQLLEDGADPDSTYEGLSNDAPIIHAVANGNIKMTELLIQHGANIEAKSRNEYTPVIVAATQNNGTEMLELLIKSGADVNAKTKNHVTALHIAAKASNLEAVKLLIKSGADVKVENIYGETILAYACDPEKVLPSLELIKYLIEEQKLDPNYEYIDGSEKKNLVEILADNQVNYSQEFADTDEYDANAVSKAYTQTEKYIKSKQKSDKK